MRVKLTNHGRERHRQNHDELCALVGHTWEYVPPKEDAEGWSDWQLWTLMESFGAHISLGMSPPFETTIQIPDAK